MSAEPDSTAVRVALWRALHVLIDPPPHVLEDTIGLQLVDPPANWRERGDMHPHGTKLMRDSIVARARFVEDLVLQQRPPQYVILGAGLDTFAQRHPDLKIKVFEIDRAGPQEWKRQRLLALKLPQPAFWSPPLRYQALVLALTWLFQSSGIDVEVRNFVLEGRMFRSTLPSAPPS